MKKNDKIKKFFQYKLYNDQKWLERGIVAIFERQTKDEQIVEDSKYHNLRGYNSPDAKCMSYYAKWIMSGKHLSANHLIAARKKMMKYVGQLVIISQENFAKKQSSGYLQK